jgi:hypothetical protein
VFGRPGVEGTIVSTGVAKLYWSLIRARLRGLTCACGTSLTNATVVSAGEGTTLDEYGLSETSAARLLAATEVLTVRCDHCGVTHDVGTALEHSARVASLTADDLAQWNPHAIEIYGSIMTSRLADRVCDACGGSLRAATLERATGGTTLPEFDLDDDAAVAIIAWTQRLTVRCSLCDAAMAI